MIEVQMGNGTWIEATNEAELLDMVIERESWFAPRVGREPMTTHEQVLGYLAATGQALNFGDDWCSKVRAARQPVQTAEPQTIRCACGHTVAAALVMNASLGTSCPDCYDRMAD